MFSCILDEQRKEICHFKRHKSSLRGSEMTYKINGSETSTGGSKCPKKWLRVKHLGLPAAMIEIHTGSK